MVDGAKNGGLGTRLKLQRYLEEEPRVVYLAGGRMGGKMVEMGVEWVMGGDSVQEPNPLLSGQEVNRQCLKLIK